MPLREYHFFVYILASRARDLYVGFTNNIFARVAQHREHRPEAYTGRYNIDRLVYYEHLQYVRNAIAREKELKDWSRDKKIAIIEQSNPTWKTSPRTGSNRAHRPNSTSALNPTVARSFACHSGAKRRNLLSQPIRQDRWGNQLAMGSLSGVHRRVEMLRHGA